MIWNKSPLCSSSDSLPKAKSISAKNISIRLKKRKRDDNRSEIGLKNICRKQTAISLLPKCVKYKEKKSISVGKENGRLANEEEVWRRVLETKFKTRDSELKMNARETHPHIHVKRRNKPMTKKSTCHPIKENKGKKDKNWTKKRHSK